MTLDTAMGNALKNAVQTMSKKKQTELIAEHIYGKYEVFSRFKPLAIGIEQELIAALPQFDPALIARVLSNHCRRPRYIKALTRGGKRFNLQNRFQGEITAEEQQYAQQHPLMQEAAQQQAARKPQQETAAAEPSTAAQAMPTQETVTAESAAVVQEVQIEEAVAAPESVQQDEPKA